MNDQSFSTRVLVFFLDMTEQNPEEHLTDELDFYDFLEQVSDKVDEITRQSRQQCKTVLVPLSLWTLVEERKNDSRQLWMRTRDEVEEQKRLLKRQLQERIHVWSDSIKKPTFIRTRDKVSFSIGVANACFSPLIGNAWSPRSDLAIRKEFFCFAAGRWPHLLPLVYTIQALFLIPLRFFIYKRKSWHYFGRTNGLLAFDHRASLCSVWFLLLRQSVNVDLPVDFSLIENSLRRMLQFQSWTGGSGHRSLAKLIGFSQ